MRTSTISTAALLLLAACGGSTDDPVEPPPPPATDGPSYELLGAEAHLVRASMAIRGVRPTPDELARVREDADATGELVDVWLDSPEFGETVKDMVNEWLLVRADVVEPLPALGPNEGRLLHEMSFSLSEAPLELARHVVENDRPLTELVTADYTLADDVVATTYGLPYDPEGAEWQVTHWQDGRPTAGLLSDSELWRRHESAGSNNQRLRANVVAEAFLCSSFANRDVTVEGGITISDEFEVAEAVKTDPLCISCHQGLDPLAAFFFGFKKQTKRSTVMKAYRSDCVATEHDDPFIPYTQEEYCYPIELYSTEEEDEWEYWDMRPPGFYGQPGEDLVDLGQMIADDPRFAQCMARKFYGYFTETDPLALDVGTTHELQQVVESSDFSAKALARAIVMSEPFRAVRAADGADPVVPAAGLLMIRPEQYARMVADLTGFEWVVAPDLEGCERDRGAGTECWGTVDLMRSDLFGFRAMAGGINSFQITAPTHSPTPPRELVAERFAGEAAGFVVGNDLSEPDPAARRLLTLVEGDTTDEAAVRTQIVALVERITSQLVETDDPLVSDLYRLFADKLDRSASTEEAWALVITALLLDPDVMFF